jgi:osmotically-inducible protein OsmY
MKSLRTTASAAIVIGSLALAACAPTPTRQGTGEYIGDAAMTAKVKTALLTDPEVKGTDVNVETFRGVVQLSGFVDSKDEIKRATERASEVKGVNSVRNDLQVKHSR